MKEIELTSKAEEDLEAIWDYSFRQFGIVQADAYIGRIAAVFDVLAMHDIGTHRAELGDNICSLPVEQHMIYFGHCCKVSDEAAFCLIQRPYISKTLLTRRISPRGSP
ncbi:type II toxin-antitoxin system RelE/ParE family toxin [Citrobacter sp. Cf120]|uniref:type II toxin-antitoxin system RelE/ParE family toxin n=1 Tax=Citrobacter sp. Cf120 TaxID=2985070 RepID=UPI002578234D|nr:type II toxin-antitoxin system RelE/ParE family toxin [Citrobacter sp. Cf120]MDM3138999.1 type II toxin-antitoxin system RelE/ParE family toxin [Citrobacter sp. Cf120]